MNQYNLSNPIVLIFCNVSINVLDQYLSYLYRLIHFNSNVNFKDYFNA